MKLHVTWVGLILVCLVTANLALESVDDDDEPKKDEKIANETSKLELSSNQTEETADRLNNRNATVIESEASGNATELARETRKIVTTPLGKQMKGIRDVYFEEFWFTDILEKISRLFRNKFWKQ